MAGPALDLRPRGAVLLLDAALRVVTRSSGLWALALPSSALVLWAVIRWLETPRPGSMLVPAALVTGAWLVRALFHAAQCHLVQEEVLGGPGPTPGPLRSLREALRHLPSVWVCAGTQLVINAVTLPLSLGIAAFLLNAHVVGYAAALQGRGRPLALYATCRRLLGPAQRAVTGVRVGLWIQTALLIVNLHVAANVAIYLLHTLLGLDLAFANRYASVRNEPWVVMVVAIGLLLMEPVRAAASALLVIDGRVRQEGLDLLSAVEQLPARKVGGPGLPGVVTKVGAALLVLGCALGAPAGAANQSLPRNGNAELIARVDRLARHCELERGSELDRQRAVLGKLGDREHSALSRFVQELEGRAYDDDDCEGALATLETRLALITEAVESPGIEPSDAPPSARDAAARAQDILARPEFAPRPVAPVVEEEEKPEERVPDENSLWSRMLNAIRDFLRWLDRWLSRVAPSAKLGDGLSAPTSGLALARVLVIVLGVAAVGVVAVLLWRSRFARRHRAAMPGGAGGAIAVEGVDAESALSRPPEGWAQLADQLAARGAFREAVRSLYLALLARLHADGAIDYRLDQSNWDYCRRFKGPTARLTPFRELTLRFDLAYYGNQPVGAEGYRAFRVLSGPFLGAASDGGEARASA